MELFDRLKFLADKQGKSINDVERDMGYSQNTLYRLKRTNPSAKKLTEIADYFNVSADYLLGRIDEPNPITKEPSRFDTLAAHAADRNHQITDEELTKIEAYLDGLIDAHENNK